MPKPLIFGISNTCLTKEEIELFKCNPCEGSILFSRNIDSKKQVKELIKSLKALYPERNIPILVDQEGGRVVRVKPPVASRTYPPSAHFANIYNYDKNLAKQELIYHYSHMVGELINLGFSSPCSPVCDLFFPSANNIIGDRSFGSDPKQVIDLCNTAINIILDSGGIPCIKHIPGHGRSLADSHLSLPVITTSLEELESTDFKVFKNITKNNIWAMTAHIIYSAIDSKLPATISPKVIQYIRDKIGFKGKLISDDLGMYALHGEIGRKHLILNKVKQLASKNLAWREDYLNSFVKLFPVEGRKMNDHQIIEFCTQQLETLFPDFCQSLGKAAKMSLDAGCDTVLHCSGDLNEMRAICNII
jgi:beta-N-acetylhexosaminidase